MSIGPLWVHAAVEQRTGGDDTVRILLRRAESRRRLQRLTAAVALTTLISSGAATATAVGRPLETARSQAVAVEESPWQGTVRIHIYFDNRYYQGGELQSHATRDIDYSGTLASVSSHRDGEPAITNYNIEIAGRATRRSYGPCGNEYKLIRQNTYNTADMAAAGTLSLRESSSTGQVHLAAGYFKIPTESKATYCDGYPPQSDTFYAGCGFDTHCDGGGDWMAEPLVDDDADPDRLTGSMRYENVDPRSVSLSPFSTYGPFHETLVEVTYDLRRGNSLSLPQEVAERYAPEVRFHKGETYFPMNQRTFIRRSELRWSHNSGCPDKVLAERTDIDMVKLGAGGYRHREAYPKKGLCARKTTTYTSAQATRPYQDVKDNKEKTEGFFLDLDNDDRSGYRPVNGRGVPVFYNYVPGSISRIGSCTAMTTRAVQR
jgi:hypothetical protein